MMLNRRGVVKRKRRNVKAARAARFAAVVAVVGTIVTLSYRFAPEPSGQPMPTGDGSAFAAGVAVREFLIGAAPVMGAVVLAATVVFVAVALVQRRGRPAPANLV